MNGGSGPRAASEIFASQRKNRSEATTTARHQLAQARADALVIVTAATANGTLEATPQLLNATAGLAVSLAFDLRVEVSA